MSPRQGPSSAESDDKIKSPVVAHAPHTTRSQDEGHEDEVKDASRLVEDEQKDGTEKLYKAEGDSGPSSLAKHIETSNATIDRKIYEDTEHSKGEDEAEIKSGALRNAETGGAHDRLLPHSHNETGLEDHSKPESTIEPAIRSIMQQFTIKEEIGHGDFTSGRSPIRVSSKTQAPEHPPRSSSLEAARHSSNTSRSDSSKELPSMTTGSQGEEGGQDSELGAAGAAKAQETAPNNSPRNGKVAHKLAATISPESRAATSGAQARPANIGILPNPEPNPPVSFDFHRFLDQLRHRSADPVAKYLRSFLLEFGKKQWMVHEQVTIIRDFLTFIAGKMAQSEVWRGISEAEFDNAREGMEKLIMNRLYSQTFSPAIESSSSKAKNGNIQPERRGQHQEDIEHDNVLAQKVRIYKWVKEEHLDIAPVGDSGKRFLLLAQQELLKIDSYRAPRDKVICVLNCCKVIFGLLRNSNSSDTSADSFMPLLIFVILKAGPEHLVSNAQYITRFRDQDKLIGEAGYYVSSLLGAIQFIENLDRTSLTISDHEFEQSVEAAVSAIAEREIGGHAHFDRDVEVAAGATQEKASDGNEDEETAVTGLIRSIQKPLSSIGRIFSDETSASLSSPRSPNNSSAPSVTPRKLSRAFSKAEPGEQQAPPSQRLQSPRASAEAAARQASAEVAEARLNQAEHRDVVETLASMFPSLDKDIIDDVVRMKEGRVGSAVDACLALNTDA